MIFEHCAAKDGNSRLDSHKHQFNKNITGDTRSEEEDMEQILSYSMEKNPDFWYPEWQDNKFRKKFYFEMDLEYYGSCSMGCSNCISHFCSFKYLYTNGKNPLFKDCQLLEIILPKLSFYYSCIL